VPCRLRHLPEMLTQGLRILTTDMLAVRVSTETLQTLRKGTLIHGPIGFGMEYVRFDSGRLLFSCHVDDFVSYTRLVNSTAQHYSTQTCRQTSGTPALERENKAGTPKRANNRLT
jgi:hypothetical protein